LVKNKSWLPANATNVVSVDGVPLSALIKRTDTFDLAAEHAMAAKDFSEAANYYAEYLKKDRNNPVVLLNYANALAQSNHLPEAIAAVQQATKIDPEDAQAWGFLAQLYQATGNATGAREANGRAKAIMAELQEESGE
jgi:predicted Zn-dependent protease